MLTENTLHTAKNSAILCSYQAEIFFIGIVKLSLKKKKFSVNFSSHDKNKIIEGLSLLFFPPKGKIN